MSKPPRWPFRCPLEGWYLSNVEAMFLDTPQGTLPALVLGVCKQHGEVQVTNPECYDPELWSGDD